MRWNRVMNLFHSWTFKISVLLNICHYLILRRTSAVLFIKDLLSIALLNTHIKSQFNGIPQGLLLEWRGWIKRSLIKTLFKLVFVQRSAVTVWFFALRYWQCLWKHKKQNVTVMSYSPCNLSVPAVNSAKRNHKSMLWA